MIKTFWMMSIPGLLFHLVYICVLEIRFSFIFTGIGYVHKNGNKKRVRKPEEPMLAVGPISTWLILDDR